MDYIDAEIYAFDSPKVRKTILPGRQKPQYLSEIKSVGGGSFTISTSDPKIVADPSLLDSRNVVKYRVNDKVVAAWLIIHKNSITIGDGERAVEAKEVSGEGLKTWFGDAEVRPRSGLKATSLDTRYFNFGTEKGLWYNAAEWITPFNLGVVHGKDHPGWTEYPDKWPEGSQAQWIWGQPYSLNAPMGFCYFRYEFSTNADRNYAIYAAADDQFTMYLDGEQLAVTDLKTSALRDTVRVDVSIPAGDHVLAFSAQNSPAHGGPAALVAAVYSVVEDIETKVFQTGDSGWKVNAYPASIPGGWTAGEIMLKLLAEAQSRGVLFPTYITPTFTSTHDSNGVLWADKMDWSFGVGESMASVLSKMEELICDAWIDPDNYNFHMVAERGKNRTIFGYDVDGVTVISTPVIFEKGKNLQQASSESLGKIKNSLSVKTADGWLLASSTDTSSSKYGTIEGTLDTGTSADISKSLASLVFEQRSTEEEGASYNIVATDKIPLVDFDVADWVKAPNDTGLLVPRKVMSISITEGDSGNALYALEFDTIFRDNEDRFNKILSKLSAGGLGGGFSNAGGGGSNFGNPVLVTPPSAPPIKIPKAPTGLTGTSDGYWSPNGVIPYSKVVLSWVAVTQNTDNSVIIPTAYEVWARPTSAGDEAYVVYATSTTPTATISNLEANSQWTFKVRTIGVSRNSSFSAEFTHIMVGPIIPMAAPDAPIGSSSNGLLTVYWTGLLQGNTPPPQFRYVYLMISTTENGVYYQAGSTFSRDARSISVAGLTVGGNYWLKLIATDGVGLQSAPSIAVQVLITGIAMGDLDPSISDAIDEAIALGTSAHETADGKNTIYTSIIDPAEGVVVRTNYFPNPDAKNPLGIGFSAANAFGQTRTITPNALNAWSQTLTSYRITMDTVNGDDVGNYPNLLILQLDIAKKYTLVYKINSNRARNVEPPKITGAANSYTVHARSTTTNTPLAAMTPKLGWITFTRNTSDANHVVSPGNLIGKQAGDYLEVADVMIYEGDYNASITHFSGNTQPVGADDYAWAGEADNSYSVHKRGGPTRGDQWWVLGSGATAGRIVGVKIWNGALWANYAFVADSILVPGSVGNIVIADGAITAPKIGAQAVEADNIKAGAIQTSHLDAGVGGQLDISANGSINLVVGQVDAVNNNLKEMQTYYQFGASGAIIGKPQSPYQLALRNDRIEMLENGNVVSYWNAGQMYVNSFIGEKVILGNHQLEKYGTGTVVRAL